MFKCKGSRHNEAVRTILRAIMGSTGLSGLQLQNKTLRLAMSQLSKSSPSFLLIFVFFLLYLYWLTDGKLPETKSKIKF